MTNLQHNAITGIEYQGKNQGALLSRKSNGGYHSDAWVTFLQARSTGRMIKKGEHGCSIIKFVDFEDEAGHKTGSGPRVYTVFNLDQTTLIEAPELAKV